MERCNDDYYIGCEDIYSDSGDRRRRDNRSDEYRRRQGSSPESRSRDPRRQNYRYSGDVNREPRRDGYSERAYRDRGHDRQRDDRPYRANQSDHQQRRDPRGYDRRSDQARRKNPRRSSRRALIVICLVLVLAIIGGTVTIAVVNSRVKNVKTLTSSEVGANQVVLSWDKVNKADGYRIMAAKDNADFTEIMTITDPDTLSATVTGLDQASVYRFSLITLKGNKESDPTMLENIRTLPEAPSITNIFSAEPGTIHLDWSKNDAANGYIVEYKKSAEDYSADKTVTISDPEQCKTDIADLEVDTDYTVRVSAYASLGETVKSAPSEEQSVTVTAKSVEVVPKAMDQQSDAALDPDKPMIALTFDDGPAVNGDSSDRILDVLEKNNAKATFFMVGYYASENTANVQRKADLKMELGNHTWDHTHYGNSVTPDDIRRASNQVYEITGQYTTCFRSPGGETTGAILSECANENMAAYYWSIDTQDWNSRNADAIYHSVMDNVKDGDIILMHEIYDSTAEAVERMVPELIAQGYQLVTCHDLIKLKGGSEPEPGTQYINAFTQSDI